MSGKLPHKWAGVSDVASVKGALPTWKVFFIRTFAGS